MCLLSEWSHGWKDGLDGPAHFCESQFALYFSTSPPIQASEEFYYTTILFYVYVLYYWSQEASPKPHLLSCECVYVDVWIKYILYHVSVLKTLKKYKSICFCLCVLWLDSPEEEFLIKIRK